MRESKIPWRHYARDYAYIFDGDEWPLTPGEDITSIPSFRVMMTRLCQQKGLRYRSQIHDGQLWVEVYRNTPGDLFEETYDEQGLPRAPQPRL